MDGLSYESLALFLVSTFVGGLTSGLAGFAMGLVVSGVWLHIITPVQTVALIAGYGLVTQAYGTWTLRQAFDWRSVAPFVIAGAVGIPLGTLLLTYVNPAYMRTGVGVLLLVYSIYGLARPHFRPPKTGLPTDLGVGFANGLLGGLTGLSGIIITVWCQMRIESKDAQRTIFQPVNLAAMAMNVVSLGVAGAISGATVRLYLLGLVPLFAGLWSGLKLYGKLDDAAFRKVILLLLLASGLVLIVPRLPF
jgi:uncharacterized membrane protein YfcA